MLQQEKTTTVYHAGNRVLHSTTDASSITFAQYVTQGLAEIPDDLATQLWVEPLVWGICPWAPFQRDSKHFSCHGALVCRASGFCCGDDFQKQRFCCCDSVDISSEQVSLVTILLPLGISQEQGVWKETKDNSGLETEHQGRSGSNFSRHAATSDAQLPETLAGMRWQGTPPYRHYIQEVNTAIKMLGDKDNSSNKFT